MQRQNHPATEMRGEGPKVPEWEVKGSWQVKLPETGQTLRIPFLLLPVPGRGCYSQCTSRRFWTAGEHSLSRLGQPVGPLPNGLPWKPKGSPCRVGALVAGCWPARPARPERSPGKPRLSNPELTRVLPAILVPSAFQTLLPSAVSVQPCPKPRFLP